MMLAATLGCRAAPSSAVPVTPTAGAAAVGAARSVAPSFEPVAVLELFTSEGCVSCPTADELAEELKTQAERAGHRVYLLGYHVDYWNELGHVDRFSAPRFTERQRWYAEGWGTSRAYTPQMVVGGTKDVSGNDRRGLLMAVSTELELEAEVGIALTGVAAGAALSLRYAIEPARGPDFLTLALVQDAADTLVKEGANAGRALHHVNVVRDVALAHVGSGRGTFTIELPPDMPAGCVIAFVQHARTRRVLGASLLRVR